MALTRAQLEPLRDALRRRGQRTSLFAPGSTAPPALMAALEVVEEWGAFVEAMYLMMAADLRVKNVEREVLRGALALLSDDRVRSRDFEAMLEAATRRVASDGATARLAVVLEQLAREPAKAEAAVAVASAIAIADETVVAEEHALLTTMCRRLSVDERRVEGLVALLERGSTKVPVGEGP